MNSLHPLQHDIVISLIHTILYSTTHYEIEQLFLFFGTRVAGSNVFQSDAVMPLADLLKIIRKNISPKQQNVFPNGLICLKGGELEKEAMPFKNKTTMWNLKEFFEEEFFQTKKVVYVSN